MTIVNRPSRRFLVVSSAAFVVVLFAWAASAGDEAPALPEGLNEPAQAQDKADAQGPALPEGLGTDEPAGPALPEGLDSRPAAPAAPDAEAEGPQLPEGLWETVSGEQAAAGEQERPKKLRPNWLHGFWDVRGGVRTQNDPAQSKDATLGELRLQLEADKAWNNVVFKYRGDFIGYAVL